MTAIMTFLPLRAQKWVQLDPAFHLGKKDLSCFSQELWKRAFANKKKLIITAGMYGAGTTWTHNVLLNALETRGLHTHAAYAERLGLFLLMKLRNHDALLLKAHALSMEDENVLRASDSKVLIPIRDPRDAVCSLMARFGNSFEKAAARVKGCADNILDVQVRLPHSIFRYEDHFIERTSSVQDVARAAGVHLSAGEAMNLHETLSADRVRQQVQKAVSSGAPYWRGYDSKTQWHRNHLGDGKVGKFRTNLDAAQIQILNRKFSRFLHEFAYPL